jgi:N-acetylglucosaminyldiphosphoundecaprenol N-acetyl-beta-D-mannosaminyltransferase
MTYLHGIKIFHVDIDGALEIIVKRIPEKRGDYFCFLNIHLVMEGVKSEQIKSVLNDSSGNLPDGMGVAWALKFLGHRFEGRVRGTDLMLKLCEYASKKNLKIYLYGNTEQTLISLREKLMKDFPGIEAIEYFSPPFRELTEQEDKEIVERINQANPDIIFVSLGAPKQEIWMAKHKGKIKAVQLGVGAAFDFITGNVRQAPEWMQKSGLEWFYRLPQQPRKTLYRMSLVPEFLWRTLKGLRDKG